MIMVTAAATEEEEENSFCDGQRCKRGDRYEFPRPKKQEALPQNKNRLRMPPDRPADASAAAAEERNTSIHRYIIFSGKE